MNHHLFILFKDLKCPEKHPFIRFCATQGCNARAIMCNVKNCKWNICHSNCQSFLGIDLLYSDISGSEFDDQRLTQEKQQKISKNIIRIFNQLEPIYQSTQQNIKEFSNQRQQMLQLFQTLDPKSIMPDMIVAYFKGVNHSFAPKQDKQGEKIILLRNRDLANQFIDYMDVRQGNIKLQFTPIEQMKKNSTSNFITFISPNFNPFEGYQFTSNKILKRQSQQPKNKYLLISDPEMDEISFTIRRIKQFIILGFFSEDICRCFKESQFPKVILCSQISKQKKQRIKEEYGQDLFERCSSYDHITIQWKQSNIKITNDTKNRQEVFNLGLKKVRSVGFNIIKINDQIEFDW